MKNIKTRHLRVLVQASIFIILIIIVALYNLYTNEIADFKILGIGDLNPYGGWNALREFATDSSYGLEGFSKTMSLTIALIVMTILGGRFFCGWLCPVGAVQDLAAWLGSKGKAPKYKGLGKNEFNPLLLKYPILLSILLASILGYGSMISNFSPWRALLSLPQIVSAWDEMKLGFIILAGIFLASIFLSRFFCRYLCPLGAAQALLSSFSPLSLKYKKSCISCNKCINECPIGIKPSSRSDMISPECIRCLNCVEDCKVHKDYGINLRIRGRNVPTKAYIILMLILFFVIWIGVPKLFYVSNSDLNISMAPLRDGTYQGEAKGFAGKIVTEIKVAEGKIIEIEVLEHHESKGWYEEVFMVLPREMIKRQIICVDGISGATKTSEGLIKSVENALKEAR